MKKQKHLPHFNQVYEIRIETKGARGGYNVTVCGDAGVYDKVHGYVDTAITVRAHNFSAVQDILSKLSIC